jgi:hypothetical protein
MAEPTLTLEQLRGVKGLGENKVQRLIEHFGSIEQVAQASADELASIQGVGKNTAQAIAAIARGEEPPAPPAGNGEKPKRARKAAEKRTARPRAQKTDVSPVAEEGDGENTISGLSINGDTLVLRDARGKTQRFKLARPSLVLDLHDTTREAARSYASSLQF